MKRESAFNKHFISPSLSTVTFKVGEALQGTVAPVQEEKAQPAAGIKLPGIRLNMREDFPVFPAVTFRAVQVVVLNSLEVEACL